MSLGKGNRRRWWKGCAVVVATASLLAAVAGTAGASARSAGGLAAVRAALAQRLVPGSAVGIDPATRQVVLTVTDTATRTAGLIAAARGFGPAVRITHVPGGFSTTGHIFGGNGIIDNNDGVICTLGFNTTGGFALTAGHCAQFAGPWFKEGTSLLFGPAIDSEFANPPANTDFGLLRDDGGVTQRAAIQGYDAGIIPVTGAANPFVGEAACKSGRTTSRTCGSVTAVNVTVIVNDNGVLVEEDNMIQTNICVLQGDSGGPLYDGGTALGLTSASNLDCGAGATSFFQPVVPALNFYGVSLLTS